LRKTIADLQGGYKAIEDSCKDSFAKLPKTEERRMLAEAIKKEPYPSILFSMLNGKDYSQIIWKLLRPVYSKPFAQDEEA